MTNPEAARSFLLGEVEGLDAFDFLAVVPVGSPLHALEITRREDTRFEVRVPGRPRNVPELPVALRSALRDRGFASEDPADPTRPWVGPATDAESAVDQLRRLLGEVFEEKPGVSFDLAHGSHRPEHEARQKILAVRRRIEPVIEELIGRHPEKDADEDYVIRMGDVHVTVAPRAALGGPLVVRVFAITNAGVSVTPELGLFLARLNFSLMFGRFALDTDHRAIWFDENLLGEQFSDEELRFTIRVVASTADEWDDRLKQMFGGVTYQEVLTSGKQQEPPPVKPGGGGYL